MKKAAVFLIVCLAAPAAFPQTKMLEDFGGGRLEVQLSHAEWSGGAVVRSAEGAASVDPLAGPDGSACARFAFSAEIGTDDLVGQWGESYLAFAAILKPNVKPSGYAGISFSLRAEGCVLVQVVLRQQQKKNEWAFAVELLLNAGAWDEVKLPFAAFAPQERDTAFDPKLPFTLSVEVPFSENWHRFAMRTGTSLSATLLLDNLALYQTKTSDPPNLIESFDDAIRRLSALPELYGAARYSETDAEGNAVERPTPGVKTVVMRMEHREGGPFGRYLAITTRLEATPDLLPLLEKEMGTTFVLPLHLSRSLEKASRLSFYARSTLLAKGAIEYQDNEHERSYAGPDFYLSGTWTRIVVPFDELVREEETLADAKDWTANPVVQLYFDLPVEALREAATKGSIEFEVALDQLVTE